MRYAIISDIHANRQALQAALIDIRGFGVNEIICLGDLVGYGPCPAEVMEKIHETTHHLVLGNHDAVIAGKISAELFNDNARSIIEWTASALDKKAASYFDALPIVLEGDDARFVHGEFAHPGRFNYVCEPDEAMESFNACAETALFAGHSHVPGTFMLAADGSLYWRERDLIQLEEGNRYIFNPGSIGQPRDNDFRSSYCVFDTDAATVTFRKVPFDIDAYRSDLSERGVPESASYFLSIADEAEPPPLRDLFGFTPPETSTFKQGANDVQNLQRTVTKLQRRVWWMSAALVILLAATAFLVYKYVNKKPEIKKNYVEYAVKNSAPLAATAADVPVMTNLIAMPAKLGEISADSPVPDVTIRVTDPKRQRVTVEDSEKPGLTRFKLISEVPKTISIRFPAIPVTKGMTFSSQAWLKKVKMEGTDPTAFLMLNYRSEDGSVFSDRSKNVFSYKKFEDGHWAWGRFTSQNGAPENGTMVFSIDCEFVGEIWIRKCALERQP